MERGARPLSVEYSKSLAYGTFEMSFINYRFQIGEHFLFLRDAWNRLFSLSLFVEHMLLGIEMLEKKLAPLVLEHTRRLGQVGWLYLFSFFSLITYSYKCFPLTIIKILEKKSNLKTKDSFEAVIGLLKNCKDGAVESIFR